MPIDSYDDVDAEFFALAYEFMSEFNWIYKSSNTEYVANGVFDEVPKDWISFFEQLDVGEINRLPFGLDEKLRMPVSLYNFFNRLSILQKRMVFLPYDPIANELQAHNNAPRISAKKLVEIRRLAAEIHRIIDTSVSIRPSPDEQLVLVDIGCGIGHLSQYIHHSYGYHVLGIDANERLIKQAIERQQRHFPTSMSSVHYTVHFIQDNIQTVEHITRTCQHVFQSQRLRYVLVGLHACAMLTVTAAKLFVSMPHVVALTIMPCCYHKMMDHSDDAKRIVPLSDAIPLSRAMRCRVSVESWQRQVISIPFLRLACQQTSAIWTALSELQHLKHGAAMWDRALLTAVIEKGESIRSKRIGDGAVSESLPSIISRWPILQKYTLHNSPGDIIAWTDEHIKKAENMRKIHPNGAIVSEFLTGLQAAIQSLCEYVVLHDRVCYLKEQSRQQHIGLHKIFCDRISPRCFVLMALKNQQ